MYGRILVLWSLFQLGRVSPTLTEEVTWYQGCYMTPKGGRRHFPVVSGLPGVPECAVHCGNNGFNYTFVQTTSDRFQCGCGQSLVSMETGDCCDTSSRNRLQIGLLDGCWGVYGILGPYLTMVTIEIDRPVVVVNESVTLEIFTKRAASYNVTKDDSHTGHHLDINWKLRQSRPVHHEMTEFLDYTEVYHRPHYTFHQPGTYTIDVQVSNGISELESSLVVEVIYPEPRDLQLGFPDGLSDLPACIPKKYNVIENSASVLAVFVNTSVHLEASVSMGTDLTFTFLFEDSNEEEAVQLLGRNTSVLQKHTFSDIGRYAVTVKVENEFGMRNLTITMIVVVRHLSNLDIQLDPDSSFIATADTPLWYTVSLVTTSRDNLYLQVWYGDGSSNMVSLSDTEGPALILSGDGKDMEIIADYGDGCELIVEFTYSYRLEGLYRPRVVVLDNPNQPSEEMNANKNSKYQNSNNRDGIGNLRDGNSNTRDENSNIRNGNSNNEAGNSNSETVNSNSRFAQSNKDKNRKLGNSYIDMDIEEQIPFMDLAGEPLEDYQYIIDEMPFDISEGVIHDNSRSKSNAGHNMLDSDYMINEFGESHFHPHFNAEDDYEMEHTNSSSNVDDIVGLMSAELDREILIVKKLEGVRLHGPSIAACETIKEFVVQVPSKFNITAHWSILKVYENTESDFNISDDGNSYLHEMVFETIGSSCTLNYTFIEVGQYVIHVKLSNALNSIETKSNVLVMCPVFNLYASCDREYLQTGYELTCYAEAERGSHLFFEWIIDGYNTSKRLRLTGNYSSVFRYKFMEPDICDISVTAVNNVSSESVIVEPAIRVQDPILDFSVHRNIWTVFGQPTQIIAHYRPTSIYNQLCYFGFDYGGGEIHQYNGIVEESIGCYYMQDPQFSQLGKHYVTVHAYNRVSNMSKVVEFWVIPSLENVSVEVVSTPTVGGHVRLLVKDNGKAMVTENVYFSWKFGGEADYFTNSPLIEVSVPATGELSLNLNATTPVESEVFPINVPVKSRSDVTFLLLHDLFVAIGNATEFILNVTLEGPIQEWSQIFVNYSDGSQEVYEEEGVTRWSHTFESCGIQEVQVVINGDVGATLEVMTAYVMVEEPIRNITLHGPSIVRVNDREGYTPIQWTAEIDGGTSVLYRWKLDRTLITTLPEFEAEIRIPGTYSLHVEAWNDVSEPVYAVKQFVVNQIEHPLNKTHLAIVGNLLGKETRITIGITGLQPFSINISFGDGNQWELGPSDLNDKVRSSSDDSHIVSVAYVYRDPDEYNITVDVFNNVSCVSNWELFVPIVNVTLVTKSPWLIQTPDTVKVKAEVEGGRDLEFVWNFQNDFEETFVTSYDNQTSVATQRYDLPGEYRVSFNVTGKHYPPPGISVVLERTFLVMDPITTVILDVEKKSAELIGNSTSPVIFYVKSSGSHVNFLFEFGDGSESEIPGSELPVRHVYMTMTGEARHVYRKEGKFDVKVTARNPLGNLTQSLDTPFYVQLPPRNLHFCNPDNVNLDVQAYAGRVREDIKMCANITMGTNVTFDWKLGDQTDMVKHGSLVSHRYTTPGVRTVFVTAKNRVNKVEKSIQVYVNNELQGVQLIPNKKFVAMGDSMQYTAVVRPDYNNTATSFTWKFMFPSKSMGRERGGEKTIHSQQNVIYFNFKKESGICLGKVTAKNAISRVESETVEIHVVEIIKELEIILLGSQYARLVNKSIQFHSYHFAGTNVTYTWNFGDGSSSVVTNLLNVNKTFTKQNGYNISLTASNPVSSQTVWMVVFVMERSYCNQPDVTIVNQPGSKVQYSKHLTLEANVITDCNLTTMVEYIWLIDGQVRRELDINNRVLILPPRTLSYGIHSIQFVVKMNNTIVFGVQEVTVEVIPSPLVSRVKGGIYRLISPSQTIILDGSDSYDPDRKENDDIDGTGNRTFSYLWSCCHGREGGSRISSNHCFHDDASSDNIQCNVTMTDAVLVVPGDCLVEASNFTFNLTVKADGRQSGSVYQVLSVTKETVLDVKIIRPSLIDPVNADRKLSFYGECSNCPPGSKYTWNLKRVFTLSAYNPVRAHDLECVEANGTTYLMLQEENENITKEEEAQDIDLDIQESDMEDETVLLENELGPTPATYEHTVGIDEAGASPVLLDGIVIKEGDPGSSILNRRKRRSFHTRNNTRPFESTESSIVRRRNRRQARSSEQLKERQDQYGRSVISETTTFIYPAVLQEGGPGGRTIKYPVSYEISENTDTNPSRRIPTFEDIDTFPIREGSPGESGSSGARQHKGYPPITEGMGTGRSQDGSRELDPLVGSGADDRNRYESMKRRPGQIYTILDQRPIPVYLREDETKTGLHKESLVIKPGVLKQGLTYILELQVYNEGLGLEGVAKSSFEVNKSPIEGRCSIQPQSGIELDTQFTLLCKEWRDEHKPFQYELSYSIDGSPDKVLIYRGINSVFTFQLPAGGEHNDHNVFVSIDILDSLLAKTSVCWIPIQVKPKPYHSLHRSQLGFHRDRDLRLIYNEVTNKSSSLQKSLEKGNDAMSKVYISYLATKLNKVNESAQNIQNFVDRNASLVDIQPDVAGKRLRLNMRTELLKILRRLPVRDEAEILQTAQALAFTTAVPDELCPASLDVSLEILKSITYSARDVYGYDDFAPTGDLVPVVVQSAASIISATGDIGQDVDKTLENVLKHLISETIGSVESLVLNELKFHMTSEDPISASTDFFSILAIKHTSMHDQSLEISNAKFQFPETFVSLLGNQQENQSDARTNQNCFQSHMTTFKRNPYSLIDRNQVGSLVSGLTLYDCRGHPLQVKNLAGKERIQVELPNIQQQKGSTQLKSDLILRKWSMNIHQFNVTVSNLKHALHLVIGLVPVNKGRLFPTTVLLSYHTPPTPEYFLYKYEANKEQNTIDIFLPAGFFNVTGKYFFGIVDATYNSGRLRTGEVTLRHYTFKLWWGECLFWEEDSEMWTPEGCLISRNSSFKVTKCECNHLTAFGGRFDLIPNELTHEDVENFFSPNRNPVALTLLSIVFILYFVLLLWSCHADRHDGQKGGIIYLLDNAPMDQQKYEITVETGIRSGAGTTAKISLILHGEEGMSETRELISEDNRPMFERNSRDKFILTLPDSIGKIWKVQIWHNNFGASPSWYVSRIIVRDLNTGIPYLFICEKWLAVEEQDGKVEREFMVLEGTLDFTKALMSKSAEYMADFHIWLSIVTCPSYSGFKRTERLTLCLTILLMYMCLNAVWYRTSIIEYRGEFGLLDVSLRNITVGAIICGVVIPVGLLIEFLFRRSKPKHASSVHCKDEGEDWDDKYPSGKPNEVESEDTSEEHVPPVMTYSLLDQSIMNWPNIQTWAQKQWVKRQHMTNQGFHSEHSDESLGNIMKPTSVIVESPFIKQALSEMDQASSGFEDCNSLIRPKASVDSTHTTAAPSVAESMRTHKPKSLPDSLRMSKPASDLDSTNTSKAPSISSSGSHKSSVIHERKDRRRDKLYLPYGCRYVAWTICGVLCVGSAVVTAMYGYRFGITKSTLWLQSLFFSAMICVFISTPILILVTVLYAALQYRNDPTTALDVYDIFNRVKAKQDLLKWKTQMEMWFEGDALDRGVAARQRSRYLRFARPPQEKTLIEARKRVMKEKKALSVFRESVMFICSIMLLLVMAYSKTTSDKYSLNTAITNTLTRTGTQSFMDIKSQEEWYSWAQVDLLGSLDKFDRLDHNDKYLESNYKESSYIIGALQIRQQRVQYTQCAGNLPYLMTTCLSDESSSDGTRFMRANGISYRESHTGNFIFGNHGVYDGSGYTITLNMSRPRAEGQIDILKQNRWLDRASRAVFVEFTLYNAPTNLFVAVDLLLELPPLGVAVPVPKITSTHVFRYTSWWDNVLLACELLFFFVTMLWIKTEALKVIEQRRKYFTLPWNVLNLIICVVSVIFGVCYVYRYVIVSATVEELRNTYYENYVDLSFITLWDEILRWNVGILLFLSSVKSLRLLRYTKLFAVFGDVYRKARREIILFFALFTILQAGYASMGHVLFGSTVKSYCNIWSSLLAVTALLTSNHSFPDLQPPAQTLSTNVFLFFFTVFMLGFLTCYMVAVLSHYFRSRKRRHLLAMSGKEAILFYVDKFQLWLGLKRSETEEEPEIILPPEFTMAEIEYQVDELLFRMNALSGSHGLPEKPPCYLTDSDCTYGGGDDGISSGGSEAGQPFTEDRLEQRVQKIEDNLCSQEPFLAQLLKFDGVGMDILSMEKEKQLRSHLELEIFRQLQIQRQDHKAPTSTGHSSKPAKGHDTDKLNKDENELQITQTPNSPGQDSTSSDEAKLLPDADKNSRSKYTPSNITIQAIQDLLSKSTPEYKDFHNENSSSNPDSPRDKITFSKIRNRSTNDPKVKTKPKQQNSSTSSSEKISPDLSLNHAYMYERDNIRKPTKPTFLHSRDSSFSDAQKNSPILKLRTHITDKPMKPEQTYTGVERLIESSSGSEQDGFQVGRKLLGKRSLRKTKSRGKGKGADEGLGPALVLDELEGEDTDFHQDFTVEGLHKELMDVYEERMKELKNGGTEHTPLDGAETTTTKAGGDHTTRAGTEHTVRADVHHSSDSQ